MNLVVRKLSVLGPVCVLLAASCQCSSPSDGDVDQSTDTSKVPDSGDDTGADAAVDAGNDEAAECDGGWCLIKPGSFIYGSPPSERCRYLNMEKQANVKLTRHFKMSQTEVTRAQWKALGFMNETEGDECPKCPVGFLTWYEALHYCNALSEKEGLEKCYKLEDCEGTIGALCNNKDNQYFCDSYQCAPDVSRFETYSDCPGYRLPTAAEWQYAARAGTTTATYNGDLPYDYNLEIGMSDYPVEVLDPIAWHKGITDRAMPVGQKRPNDWGLFDVLGNVAEWTSHNVDGKPIDNGAPSVSDPQGVPQSGLVYLAGGGWTDPICKCRAGNTAPMDRELRSQRNGLRPVRTVFKKQPSPDAGN
jgi:formylglycine-generating enzyme required for sulfatase activity